LAAKTKAKAASLSAVETKLQTKSATELPSILEYSGRIVVSTDNGTGKFSLRTKIRDLNHYYVAAAAAQGRYIYFDDDNSDGWFFRSDHYNFVKKGVRAVVLENGRHPVDVSKPNKYPMPVW
jgi:Zn-dependent M28 family amino/carboxypeptidase